MSILCKAQEPAILPEIQNCGSTLTSSTTDFTWTDPGQTQNTVYGFWLGSSPGANDIYNHAGGGVLSGNAITAFNLPTDGRTIYKTLILYRDGINAGITDTIECTCTALTQDCAPGVLDCSQLNVRIFERDLNTGAQGAQLSALDGCNPSYVTLDFVDECGDFVGQGAIDLFLGITSGPGSQAFDNYDGNISFTYLYTPQPNLLTQTVSFEIGTNDPNGNLVRCEFTLPVDACEVQQLEHRLFTSIEADGPDNYCYKNNDYYAAEFLYQNPNVCYWEIDTARQCIVPIDPPSKAGATSLPPPTGGDDTLMIANFIQNGGRYTGNNQVYRIGNFTISRSDVWLCDMNIRPGTSGTTNFFNIVGSDVRFYDVDIDGLEQASVRGGIHVRNTAARFHFVKGSISNFWHRRGGVGTGNQTLYGFWLNGCPDYHIATNDFSNYINDTGVGASHTNSSVNAVADAIWLNGSQQYEVQNGFIVNNTAHNMQSNGINRDAEFVKMNTHTNDEVFNGNYPRIWANRVYDPGGAAIKIQNSGAQILSNQLEFRTDTGDAKLSSAQRKQLALIRAPNPNYIDRLVADNNRLITNSTLWQVILRWDTDNAMRNSSYDCNLIMINTDNARSDSGSGWIFAVRGNNPAGVTGAPPTPVPVNSTINNNVTLGPGRTRYYYLFRLSNGSDNPGPSTLTSGNTFATAPLISAYQ